MKNANFTLKALIFCPDFIGQTRTWFYKKAKLNFKIYAITNWERNNYNTHIDLSHEVKRVRQ